MSFVTLISGFFGGICTIITGFLVIVVYRMQKRQEKREAAIILLMEVRAAESAVGLIRSTGVTNCVTILLNNSWSKFNHLFVNDLDRDELDSVNSFYNYCYFAEVELRRINACLPLAMEEKGKVIFPLILKLAEEHSDVEPEDNLEDESKYTKAKRRILDTFYRDKEWFVPSNPSEQLNHYLSRISLISTSTAGKKLKAIAKVK